MLRNRSREGLHTAVASSVRNPPRKKILDYTCSYVYKLSVQMLYVHTLYIYRIVCTTFAGWARGTRVYSRGCTFSMARGREGKTACESRRETHIWTHECEHQEKERESEHPERSWILESDNRMRKIATRVLYYYIAIARISRRTLRRTWL